MLDHLKVKMVVKKPPHFYTTMYAFDMKEMYEKQ